MNIRRLNEIADSLPDGWPIGLTEREIRVIAHRSGVSDIMSVRLAREGTLRFLDRLVKLIPEDWERRLP